MNWRGSKLTVASRRAFEQRRKAWIAVAIVAVATFLLLWMQMPHTRFERCVSFTLRWEGELADLEGDRGGITKYGITQLFLLDFRSAITSGTKPERVEDVTREQAIQMYHALWEKEKLDSIDNESLALALFDYTVHSSARSVITRLQHLLNEAYGASLPEDGRMGTATLAAINAQNARELFCAIQDERRHYLKDFIRRNPDQQTFEKGWMARIDDLKYKDT